VHIQYPLHGHYQSKRLPFGVALSQDIFQRKLDEVYRGIPNVIGIADDIIVCGSSEQEHDKAFTKKLKATHKHNISLNSEKLQLISDFGSQYVSKRFKAKCAQSGITLYFSSPYHHQANSLAERATGTCTSLLRKALEKNEFPYTAQWNVPHYST